MLGKCTLFNFNGILVYVANMLYRLINCLYVLLIGIYSVSFFMYVLHLTVFGHVRNNTKVMPLIFFSVTCSYSFNEIYVCHGYILYKVGYFSTKCFSPLHEMLCAGSDSLLLDFFHHVTYT